MDTFSSFILIFKAFSSLRFKDEYFDAVYGDIILLLFVFPFVFVYAMLAMGKPNLVEHGVSSMLCWLMENYCISAWGLIKRSG